MSRPLRAGFTKLGFSKAGFGCCGHHSKCNMGRQQCHYEKIDPEVKDYCAAYARNHKQEAIQDPSFFIAKKENLPEIDLTEDKGGQLALFKNG